MTDFQVIGADQTSETISLLRQEQLQPHLVFTVRGQLYKTLIFYQTISPKSHSESSSLGALFLGRGGPEGQGVNDVLAERALAAECLWHPACWGKAAEPELSLIFFQNCREKESFDLQIFSAEPPQFCFQTFHTTGQAEKQ